MEAAAGRIAGWAAMYIDIVSSPRLFSPFSLLFLYVSTCFPTKRILPPVVTCSHIVRA